MKEGSTVHGTHSSAAAVLDDSVDVMVVEDENTARETLRSLLEIRGFSVSDANSGEHAVVEARRGWARIVLMDIRLPDIDGIEAARLIHLERPLTSFIFVSAFAERTEYHERVRSLPFRVGGWVQKPIDVDMLFSIIEREAKRLDLLGAIEEGRERGIAPLAYLHARADVDPELDAELVRELHREIAEVPTDREETSMTTLGAEIDGLYAKMASLLASRHGADTAARFKELRSRLRELQQREAEAIERRFWGELRFDALRADELGENVRAALSGDEEW